MQSGRMANVSDPNQWTLVKGLSAIRYFNTRVDNEFRVARLNFAYEVDDSFTLRWGGTFKQFDFDSNQERRSQDIEAINPTLAEANLPITALGQTMGFGRAHVRPGLDQMSCQPRPFRAIGIDCNFVTSGATGRAVPTAGRTTRSRERHVRLFHSISKSSFRRRCAQGGLESTAPRWWTAGRRDRRHEGIRRRRNPIGTCFRRERN